VARTNFPNGGKNASDEDDEPNERRKRHSRPIIFFFFSPFTVRKRRTFGPRSVLRQSDIWPCRSWKRIIAVIAERSSSLWAWKGIRDKTRFFRSGNALSFFDEFLFVTLLSLRPRNFVSRKLARRLISQLRRQRVKISGRAFGRAFEDSGSSIGLNRANFWLPGYSDRKFHYDWVKVRDARGLEVTIEPRSKFSVNVSYLSDRKWTLEIARADRAGDLACFSLASRFSFDDDRLANAAAQDFTTRTVHAQGIMPLRG